MTTKKPIVALVGRPNVGKSTLFNRITGTRTAIVEDIPGTTRDRIYGEGNWNGIDFVVVDTGGLEAPTELAAAKLRQEDNLLLAEDSAKFIPQIQNQAQVAMDEADAIIFVVDAKEGMSGADEEVADLLRATNVPIFIAANKAESPERRLNSVEFWTLGIGEPVPISAFHGTGVGDLLDLVAEVLPQYSDSDIEDDDTVSIALVGRPNVGKSSLLNRLTGVERAIVSNVPGTTRDPIDTEITYHGQKIVLVDTAGIRRRGRVEKGIEKYSVLRSMRGIDRADVALLLIDAVEGVTAQDTHVAGYVLEKYKGIIVLINKWDLIEKDSYTMLEFADRVREELKFMSYVPFIFVSALTQQRLHKILPTALEVAQHRRHRISTSQFNQLIQNVYDSSTPPSKHGRKLRLYYGSQVSVAPPTFTIFTNDADLVHFSYERYIENRIREFFPFTGTPIRLYFRSRTRKDEKNS